MLFLITLVVSMFLQSSISYANFVYIIDDHSTNHEYIIKIHNEVAVYTETNMENQILDTNDIQKSLDVIPDYYYQYIHRINIIDEYKKNVLGSYFNNSKSIIIYGNKWAEGLTWNKLRYTGIHPEVINMKKELDHVLIHEIAHSIWYNIDIVGINIRQLYEESSSNEPQLEYSIEEDFAESFSEYILNTDEFKTYCPSKWIIFEFISFKLRCNVK